MLEMFRTLVGVLSLSQVVAVVSRCCMYALVSSEEKRSPPMDMKEPLSSGVLKVVLFGVSIWEKLEVIQLGVESNSIVYRVVGVIAGCVVGVMAGLVASKVKSRGLNLGW